MIHSGYGQSFILRVSSQVSCGLHGPIQILHLQLTFHLLADLLLERATASRPNGRGRRPLVDGLRGLLGPRPPERRREDVGRNDKRDQDGQRGSGHCSLNPFLYVVKTGDGKETLDCLRGLGRSGIGSFTIYYSTSTVYLLHICNMIFGAAQRPAGRCGMIGMGITGWVDPSISCTCKTLRGDAPSPEV